MRKTNSQNLKLGIFVIAGVVLFVIAVYLIGNQQNLFGNNTMITSVFKDVSGLQPGNNVRFAGVNVGTVKVIEIVNDTSIAVGMSIDDRTIRLIKKNTLATISSDGLVGSMIVNLIPGENGTATGIQPGDTIGSISKIATADMLTTLNTTNENAAMLTADLLKITNSINKGEGTLGALIKDEEMAIDIKESIRALRQTSQAASASVNRLNNLLSGINYEESVAGVLLSDTAAAGKMKGIIQSLDQSATEIQLMTSNLQLFSEDLRKGEGALNYVLKDTTVTDHLDASLQNVEEATRKLNENMEALQHNILFRGYFRKLERQKAREEKRNRD